MIHLLSDQKCQIIAHAEQDYPFECCGLLLGKFGETMKSVHETFAISNAREEVAKRTRFLITPAELLAGERYARTRELDIVGFYHSHPDHPAIPSEYDRDHAWPTYSYLVVSVAAGKAGDIRSWELEPDRTRFNEEKLSERNSK